MKTTTQIIDALVLFFQLNLPNLLTEAGLPQIVQYSNGPQDGVDERILFVLHDTGTRDPSQGNEGFAVILSLPGEMRPDRYDSVIFPLLCRNFDPHNVGFLSHRVSHQTWYPGEAQRGEGSSFLEYQIDFSTVIDDCDQ